MKLLYLSDNLGDHPGGAEQNDSVLIEILRQMGHDVLVLKSDSEDIVEKSEGRKLIVSNFIFMFASVKKHIEDKCDYVIYEHDHKYLLARDPSHYPNYVAPQSEVVNKTFYQNANAVFCQSNLHAEILNKNLSNVNTVVLGGNLWSDDILDHLESLSLNKKESKYCIMRSNIEHKNTYGCVKYCESVKQPYVVIGPLPHGQFLEEMSKYSTFFFIPKTVETLSRIVVEARMLNCKVVTNNKIGAASMDWFKMSGKELIDAMRKKREEIPNLVLRHLE